MAHANRSQPLDGKRRSVFLFGLTAAQPWYRERVINESQQAGLNVVVARVISDRSEDILKMVHRELMPVAATESHTTEVLPDKVDAISHETRSYLHRQYGNNWCALPLSDYVTEYAAAISADLSNSCYPVRSAEIVKRKHQLRQIWNQLAASNPSLSAVEYSYLEAGKDGKDLAHYCSDGFHNLPEETSFIVKPDELSSSIEIHRADSKTEALAKAHEVCEQLLSKWHKMGQSIGTLVLPRVLIESAIDRSSSLHPGAEFSVEFLSFLEEHYSVGITQKWIGPNFVESGHLFPAGSLPRQLASVVENAICKLLQELKVCYAVSHWEFIVTTDERIALVEGHLRPAGGRIMELIEVSTGQSPTAALCKAMANGSPGFSFRPKHSCGLFWLVPKTPLTRVDKVTRGPGALLPELRDLYINEEGIKATANWSHASDWTTRFVHALAAGDDATQITSCCRRVADDIILFGERDGVPASTALKLAIDD